MSDFTAITNVTLGLAKILNTKLLEGVAPDPSQTGLNLTSTQITLLSPDNARAKDTGPQINLFLYQVMPDAAWRNLDTPRQVKPGETAMPPLALTLYYLVTAYGPNNDELLSQALLGWVMSLFNDYPLLGPQDVPQAERVRITLQPMSLEEMSKLWLIFQSPYHVSAVYQISVVLIDSTRQGKATLPVLRRGPLDSGPAVRAGAFPPTLESVSLDSKLPVARLGDRALVTGQNLAGVTALQITSFRRPDAPVVITTLESKTATEIRVFLDPALNWVAGLLALKAVAPADGQHKLSSNDLPFALAPAFRTPLVAGDVTKFGNDSFLTLATVVPTALPEQNVLAVFNAVPPDTQVPDFGYQIPAEPAAAGQPADSLRFKITKIPSGTYLVRLRVDGMDRVGVVRDATGFLSFDSGQQVTVP